MRHGAVEGSNAERPWVAGRYQLEEELARGGMGQVHRALDRATGRHLAIKRLLDRTSSSRGLLPLFEREYRTLRSLRHPRIIEVYDYGVDDGGAYYTMELLSGTDLARLAPLPHDKACAHLRDLASSLALLEARRLLHRDVSPRNARVTADGRCKLLDFGALTGFGVPTQLVGTPPCVPPEAIRGAPLDQRADLYALGATAYFVLTGRHAHPVTTFADLPRAWKEPVPPPSRYAPDIPPALDALIMSLIHHDPLARPESAGEVIDRLNAVVALASDPEPLTEASYFFSTELIARSPQLERTHAALRAAQEGRGGAVLICGASGTGLTRLLGEACVQAQLSGATVLQVDADRERGENRVALALVTKLLDTATDEVLQAAQPHVDVLAAVLPELGRRLGATAQVQIPETPGEWRGRVQAALSGWLSTIAQSRLVTIAVDNVEAADDASAALLAALAAEARARKLLILASLRAGGTDQLSSGVRFLRDHASVIELPPLDADQTVALARAIFGAVPNVMRLGEWLHRTSGGIAAHCFELATELRRSGAVRYVAGTWVLPDDAQVDGLPQAMSEALQRRIARLSPTATRLAEALSVHDVPFDLGLCDAIAGASRIEDPFAALDELLDHGVFSISGDRYRFLQDSLRTLVLDRIEPARRRQLHGAMAEGLLATTSADDRLSRVEAGWHLLRSGDELRGAQLLARTALAFEIGTGGLQAAVPALEEARRVFLHERASAYELLPIVSRLATEGYYSDRRLSTLYAEEAFALLSRATGLDLARRLTPFVGRKLAVYAGLASAALRFYTTPREHRLQSFSQVFVLLVNCVTTQAGAGTVCLDTESIRRAAAFIEPLTVLGSRHMLSAIHDYCICLMQMSLECQPEVRAGWLALLERLSDPEQFKSLPDYVRQLYRGGALFALGIVETWHDGDEALDRAHELESLGLRIYDRAAKQIRMLYHAGRAELEQAEHYRERMELHAIQTGSAWQVEVTVPLTTNVMYSALGDVVSVKRAAERIEQLASYLGVPALDRTARSARASYLLCRGSAEEAIALYEELLGAEPVRGFVGWARAVGYMAEGYNRLGRHEQALSACERAMQHMRSEDRRFVRMFLVLQVQCALAKAGLGRVDEARDELAALRAEHERGRNPVTLGMIHEALAQVALLSADGSAFAEHAAQVEALYHPTRVPSLVARAEKLVRSGAEVFSLPALAVEVSAAKSLTDTVSAALSACTDVSMRCMRALELVLQTSHCREGHLFLVEPDGLRMTASTGDAPELTEQAAALAVSFRNDDNVTHVEPPTAGASKSAPGYRWYMLSSAELGPDLVAMIAVREEREARPVESPLLQALAHGLRGPG